MQEQPRKNISELAFPLATAVAFPPIIVAAWLMGGDSFPISSLVFLLGVYAMGLAWAAMSLDLRARQEVAAEEVSVAIPASEPGLELLYTVPATAGPRMVTAIGGVGVCPRGIMVADRIDIDAEGRLSRPMCRVAVEAFSPLLQGESGPGTQVSCVCPLAGRYLTFEVREKSEVA